MKVTMRDVAKKANVSVATVSRALSGKGYISKETMELVVNACRELGYASFDRNAKANSNLIGVITADLKNEFYIHVIDGITEVAEQNGYNIIVYDQQEDSVRAKQAISIFSSIPIRGIILTPIMDTTVLGYEYLSLLEKLRTPLVLVDRDLKYSHFDGVFLDNTFGAYSATLALIKAGHTRIATISGTTSSLTGKDRLVGYKKAMLNSELDINEELIKFGDFTIEGGYNAALELFDMENPPTAVFVANSVMMKGFVKAIKERKKKIPDDISVISFDDMLGIMSMENLSVVAQPMKRMGERSMEILLERICVPSHYKQDTMRIVLNPKLVLRGSEVFIKK